MRGRNSARDNHASPHKGEEDRDADEEAPDQMCSCPGAEASPKRFRIDGEEQGEQPVEARRDYGYVDQEEGVEAPYDVEVVRVCEIEQRPRPTPGARRSKRAL